MLVIVIMLILFLDNPNPKTTSGRIHVKFYGVWLHELTSRLHLLELFE